MQSEIKTRKRKARVGSMSQCRLKIKPRRPSCKSPLEHQARRTKSRSGASTTARQRKGELGREGLTFAAWSERGSSGKRSGEGSTRCPPVLSPLPMRSKRKLINLTKKKWEQKITFRTLTFAFAKIHAS